MKGTGGVGGSWEGSVAGVRGQQERSRVSEFWMGDDGVDDGANETEKMRKKKK